MSVPGDQHKSVMTKELVGFLEPADGETVVDCTLGLGGHSETVLTSFPAVNVIGIDQDGTALAIANERLKEFGPRFRSLHANFSEIKPLIVKAGNVNVAGIMADLGVSSMQLDDPER